MKRTKFEVILSDLDGVIRHYPKHHHDAIEAEFGIPSGTLLPIAFQRKFLDAVVTGKITDDDWRAQIVVDVSKIISKEKAELAIRKWSQFPGQLDETVFNFLCTQKAHCKLALLTNATTKLKNDLRTLDIHDAFDFIFNTSEIGHAKPDSRAFMHVINSLKLSPEKIFFIDDRLENIDAARSLGMSAHHFQSFEGLKQAL